MITFMYLREVQQKEKNSRTLQKISNDFYKEVERLIHTKKKEIQKDDLKAYMILKEIENIKTITRFIMEKRERKIIDMAIKYLDTGKEPNTSNLIESEKELYEHVLQILVLHRKQMSIIPLPEKTQHILAKAPALTRLVESEKREKEIRNNTNNLEKETPEISKEIEDPKEDNILIKEDEEEKEEKEKVEEPNKDKEDIQENKNMERVDKVTEIERNNNDKEKEYIKLKAIKDIPEILASDKQFYGPYFKNTEFMVPKDTAKVLVIKGIAKEIDL